MPAQHRWFQPDSASPTARVRLFLLHHAGGTAAGYALWAARFPADIAVQAVQFPGRHDSPAPAAFTRIGPLVDALREALLGELDDRPYALFGHSMGALVGYRLAVAMRQGGGPEPVLLGVSGFSHGFRVHLLPEEQATDREFVAKIRTIGALPDGILAHPRLIPTLRADIALCTSYRDDGARLGCPIAAYSGTEDPLLESGSMSGWSTRTDMFLGAVQFPGGHFYLDDHSVAVAHDLGRRLQRLAVTNGPG